MVVAGREASMASIADFGCSRSAKGLARGAGRGIEGRIAACRPVVVCINNGLNEPRKEVTSFIWSALSGNRR
jgi:hypothetical protein